MPRYDYRCEAGHKYERVESFGASAEHPCDRCGRPARRVPVAPPLVFKGGGFYKTSGRGGSSHGSAAPASPRSKTKPKAGGEESASAGVGNGATDASSAGAPPPAPASAAD